METNLRNLRDKNGLTQQKLCNNLAKTGYFLDRSTYAKYETGDRSMPVEFLVALSSYYGTSVDYILKLTKNENKIM